MRAVVQAIALAVLLVAYVTVELPNVTGVAAHEWLGLALVVLLLVHAALRSERFEPSARRGRGGDSSHAGERRMSARRVGRIVLDAALLVALGVCAVSGIMMSGAVLPAFGLFADGYYLWNPLHAISAKVLLALLLVHLALNVGPVVRRTRRSMRRTDAARGTRGTAAGMAGDAEDGADNSATGARDDTGDSATGGLGESRGG